MPARKRSERKFPTRAESDAAVDAMLADLPWVSGVDDDAIENLKDVRWELRSLSAYLKEHPEAKTPEVAERQDGLRREYGGMLKTFGADPAGRKDLGLKPGVLAAQSSDKTYRRPDNTGEMVRVLVATGAWDAVGQKARAELASQDTTRKATR